MLMEAFIAIKSIIPEFSQAH